MFSDNVPIRHLGFIDPDEAKAKRQEKKSQPAKRSAPRFLKIRPPKAPMPKPKTRKTRLADNPAPVKENSPVRPAKRPKHNPSTNHIREPTKTRVRQPSRSHPREFLRRNGESSGESDIDDVASGIFGGDSEIDDDNNDEEEEEEEEEEGEEKEEEEEEEEDEEEQEEEQEPMEEMRELVLCLDLGTTNSAIVWATSSGKTPFVIKDWQMATGVNNSGNLEKAPTVMATPQQNSDLKDTVWGYKVTSRLRKILWFKLLFAAAGVTKPADDPLLRATVGQEMMLLPPNATVLEVHTWFYKLLNDYFLNMMKKPQQLGNRFRTKYKIKTILTVPATYDIPQRKAIEKAARNAGIADQKGDRIVVMSEPEAAAIYTIHESLTKQTSEIFKVSIRKHA